MIAHSPCVGCGADVPQAPRGRAKLWCTESCRQAKWRADHPVEWAAIVQRRREKVKADCAAKRSPCTHCGGPKQLAKGDYCSAVECQKAGKRTRAREQYAADPQAGRAKRAAVRAAMTPAQLQAMRDSQRAWKQQAGYTTSKRAADARRRAIKAGATVEVFANEEIFERDAWRCGICTKPIDRSRAYPDPLSVSLDHVVPLAAGGEHSRANTRAAHLSCNVKRGVGRHSTDQLALL